MEKNAVLAYEVKDIIEKHQQALNMGLWAARKTRYEIWNTDTSITLKDLTADTCDTVACMAGWTATVLGYTVQTNHAYDGDRWVGQVAEVSAEALGLDEDEAWQLFYDTGNDDLFRQIELTFGPDPRPDRR